MTGYLTFPYQLDASGHTATTDFAGYAQSLVLLVLQTDPGERVNRPTFGAGLKTLVFMGLDSTFSAAAETLIRSRLMQSLSDVIAISQLYVNISEETAQITLIYTVVYTGEEVTQVITQGMSADTGAATGSVVSSRVGGNSSQ